MEANGADFDAREMGFPYWVARRRRGSTLGRPQSNCAFDDPIAGGLVAMTSVLALYAEGCSRFRTGGSAENRASIAANLSLGYVIDEEWVTLAPPEVNV